ncbi:DNA-binding Xre family transcriptional regulator [Pseudomonas fluvialis]|uniref:DNA-binding Xre family transcriptional regulator n=2 Tax=Pseudomonas fluvialis TaxID=1793966 RepID=A0A7X0BVQ6_9PSED|nr:DNA-binding Xre family transcriptional regulator [Pseudomonas fluvialis]
MPWSFWQHIGTIHGMPRISATHDKDLSLVRLGQAVRARRNLQGLSQESLADAAEIDRSHMGKIERGERNVTFLNIARIARALQCKPSDLLLDADL